MRLGEVRMEGGGNAEGLLLVVGVGMGGEHDW